MCAIDLGDKKSIRVLFIVARTHNSIYFPKQFVAMKCIKQFHFIDVACERFQLKLYKLVTNVFNPQL